jgi:hypothetical protein
MSTNQVELRDALPASSEPPPVEKCDVSNFNLLAKYRKKRDEWLSWYSFRKDDPNNIEGQIIGMIFLDLSYRVLAKPRGDMSKSAEMAARSGILAHMLDQGYVATQVLAIRRLLDRHRNVYSIRRLLNDIHLNRDLITREIFVAYDGTPYDTDGWRSLPPSIQVQAQIFGMHAPGLSEFLRASERHEMFDKLSGVLPTSRFRQDTIRIEIFEKLKSWLNSAEAEKLVTLSHKFFAHAADVASRNSLTYSGVSLKDIEAAQKAIIKVERAITDDILCIGIAREVVAMPPLGFLKGLDVAYVPKEAIAEMDAHWDELKKDRNKWKDTYDAELYA